MLAGWLGWALAAEFAFALPWLLVLSTWGNPVYLGPGRAGISGQPPALPGDGCH